MKFRPLVFILLLTVTVTAFADRAREQKIRELEAACKKAHAEYFAPLRIEFTRECIEKGKDKDWCERFYSDYGDDIYVYDLPECLAEFEFRNNK